MDVVSLGRFRLKNVGRPLELYAVSADGIVVPDPRALEGKGERFREPAEQPARTWADRCWVGPPTWRLLVELVRSARVVTVTGPGGVGKTRILARAWPLLAPDFLDGVAFIPLADITRPRGLPSRCSRTRWT